MNENKIYILKDVDDQSTMVGNAKALWDYAKYLNDDYADEEDRRELKTFEDALNIIKSKNIIIVEIDIKTLDVIDFDIFSKAI